MSTGASETAAGDSTAHEQLSPLPRVPRPRPGRGSRSAPRDLAAVAREAVVAFLRDPPEGTQADADAEKAARTRGEAGQVSLVPRQATSPAPTAADHTADAMRAAAIGVATLDRIEAAAARLEADIEQALRRQAELHAGAGRAAEDAVRAAQEAWTAAGRAEKASGQVQAALRRIGHYAAVFAFILVVEVAALFVLLVVMAS